MISRIEMRKLHILGFTHLLMDQPEWLDRLQEHIDEERRKELLEETIAKVAEPLPYVNNRHARRQRKAESKKKR